MSSKESFASSLSISSCAVDSFARKGWHHSRGNFLYDVDKDGHSNSSDDEIWISWNSSPESTNIPGVVRAKKSRHVVTKLNFDDCVVKANQVPVASIEKIIKPIHVNDNFTLSCNESRNDEVKNQNHEHQNDQLFSSVQSVGDGLTYVPESPNVGDYTCEINRYEGLQQFHCKLDAKSSIEKESFSQDIPMLTSPRCYNLKTTNHVFRTTDQYLSISDMNDSPLPRKCNSSPVMRSSRRKKSKSYLSKILAQSGVDSHNIKIGSPKEVTLCFNSEVLKTTSNKKCVEINDEVCCDQSSLELLNCSQPPISPSNCVVSTDKPSCSPILGSKKKKYYRKSTKHKYSGKHFNFSDSCRKRLMPFSKNTKNIPSQNTIRQDTQIYVDNSSDSDNIKKLCHSYLPVGAIKKTSDIIMHAQLKKDIVADRQPKGCITNILTDSEHDLNLQKIPCVDKIKNHDLSVVMKNDGNIECQHDKCAVSFDVSQTLSPKFSRRRVKRKLKLTNNVTDSHSWFTSSQTLVTQETVTFHRICADETNSQSGHSEVSHFFDSTKIKLESGSRNTNYSSASPCSINQKFPVSESEGKTPGIETLSPNNCNECNYTGSQKTNCEVKEIAENMDILADSFHAQTNGVHSIDDPTDEKQNHSSVTFLSGDLIECSQVIANSKNQTKLCETSDVNELNSNCLKFSDISSQHITNYNKNFIRNEKCIYSVVERDNMNNSHLIEDVTSDEESRTSPHHRYVNVEAVARTIISKKAFSNSSFMKPVVPEICESEENNAISDTSEVHSDPVMKSGNIHNHLIENYYVENILPNESDGSCRISQEESPCKSSSLEKRELHVTSESSQEPDLGLPRTPPRAASPLEILDSGKKRKRLKKDGLAARLQKLLNRKKATANLIKYEGPIGKRRSGDCVLLVRKAWLEYSRLLILCSPCNLKTQLQINNTDSPGKKIREPVTCLGENVPSQWVVIMDPLTLPLSQLKENTIIKLYAPWQSMVVPQLILNLVLDVSYAELVSGTTPAILPEFPPVLYEAETFYCPCLDGSHEKSECDFQLPDHGKHLLTLLFPDMKNDHYVPSDIQITAQNLQTPRGTIADAVVLHSHSLTGDIWLCVRVHRIFCYRPTKINVDMINQYFNAYHLIWSVFGEDITGEFCEVILGSPCKDNLTAEWKEIINGSAVGQTYRVSGLSIFKRMSYDVLHGILGFVKKCDNENWSQKVCSNSIFFYIFIMSSGKWCLENKNINIEEDVLPKLDTLSDIMKCQKNEDSKRVTLIVKALAFWNKIMYVTDLSLKSDNNENVPRCVRVNVKVSCHLPNFSTKIICLQDVLLCRGELIADKYCRVFSNEEIPNAACTHIDPANIALLEEFTPYIPDLRLSSTVNDLVLVGGLVSVVDEETACSWPVCKQCGRDLVEHKHHHQLLCEQCGITDPVTKFSLDVILSCPKLPEKHVKVQLLQQSILSLIPGALEGTDLTVESVLGKSLGPIICVVLNSPSKINRSLPYDLLLQEIQLL